MGANPQQPERVRTRAQRVAARVAYESFSDKVSKLLTDQDNLLKLGLFLVTALIVCIFCKQWDPPTRFRLNTYADRTIVCKADFEVESPDLRYTKTLEARANSLVYLINDPQPLDRYLEELLAGMQLFLTRTKFEECDGNDVAFLREFIPDSLRENEVSLTFETLHNAFSPEGEMERLRNAIDIMLEPYRKTGVLRHRETLHYNNEIEINGKKQLNRIDEVMIYNADSSSDSAIQRKVSDILLDRNVIVARLREQLDSAELANLLSKKIMTTIPETLKLDPIATQAQQDHDASEIGECYLNFRVGDVIVHQGQYIGKRELKQLEAERAVMLQNRPWQRRVTRFMASFLLLSLLFFGTFVLFSRQLVKTNAPHEEHPIIDTVIFLAMTLVCVAAGRLLQVSFHNGSGSPELIPLLVFVQLTALASSWEIALTYGVILAFFFNISGPNGLNVFAVFVGSALVSSIMSRNIRTRTQLFLVAASTALTAFILSLATGAVCDDYTNLLKDSSLRGLWAFVAGFLTSGILPIFERLFGVLTPMRLLEYSNSSHPLLAELNRRAPATYSHSTQTAALAEPAAEAIGARAELVRVGAFFHDVGKMLQPENFTENQKGYNIHNTLEPRISVLVIVAHTKDGVDLAKRYKLPRQVIDLIEQHHGTMTVGYFYEKAKKLQEEKDPTAPPLDDSSFRYPGPRPQTKEAGVLMISDAVESASRSLSDWSPRRVENLVHAIVEKRIEDGQFNDSGLTLGEINTIEQSLVTTLLASHHTRVKYELKDTQTNKDKDGKDSKEIKRPEAESPGAREDYSKPPIDSSALFNSKDSSSKDQGETVWRDFQNATQK